MSLQGDEAVTQDAPMPTEAPPAFVPDEVETIAAAPEEPPLPYTDVEVTTAPADAPREAPQPSPPQEVLERPRAPQEPAQTPAQPVGAAPPAESQTELQPWRDLVATLRAQVEAQREELEARRRETQEPHVLLQQAQTSALPPPAEPEAAWWQRLRLRR